MAKAFEARLLTLAAAAALALCSARIAYLLFAPVTMARTLEVPIGPGEPTRTIAYRLEQRGIVRNRYAVLLMARIDGRDHDIRHGVHRFVGSMTPSEVVDELVRRPAQAGIAVTIPEGLTFEEIGALLEAARIVSADEYRAAVCKPELRRRTGAGTDANCIEGYLFPDTYAFTRTMTATDIVELQVARFEKVIAAILPLVEPSDTNALVVAEPSPGQDEPWVRRPPTIVMGGDLLREAVVLASIIEKETGIGAERSMVASVFHNRLRRGMRLQADPTAIYGAYAAGEKWDGTGLHRLLRKPTPYNTYTRTGLPPGPICNPGRDALVAALAPAASEYLYFVADGDGAHRFSTSLDEHNQAVARLRARTGS